MSEWNRADENGMELVNSAQYHAGIDKLWGAMKDEDGNLDTRGLDCFTLAAEAIEERNELREKVKREIQSVNFLGDRCNVYRGALAIITRLSRGFSMPPLGPNFRVGPDARMDAVLDLATKTLQGKYND